MNRNMKARINVSSNSIPYWTTTCFEIRTVTLVFPRYRILNNLIIASADHAPGIQIVTIETISNQFIGFNAKFRTGLFLSLYVTGETRNSVMKLNDNNPKVIHLIGLSVIH
jgi:hypothetical protein